MKLFVKVDLSHTCHEGAVWKWTDGSTQCHPRHEMELSGHSRPSAASLPIPVEVEAGRVPEAVWMCLEMIKSRTRTQTTVFSARSLVDTLPHVRYLSRFVRDGVQRVCSIG